MNHLHGEAYQLLSRTGKPMISKFKVRISEAVKFFWFLLCNFQVVFYPSSFVYYGFSPPPSQFLQCLLSLVSPLGAPMVGTKRRTLDFQVSRSLENIFPALFQLCMNIKSPNNILIYTNTHNVLFSYINAKKYVMRCAIWYNLKNLKNPLEEC